MTETASPLPKAGLSAFVVEASGPLSEQRKPSAHSETSSHRVQTDQAHGGFSAALLPDLLVLWSTSSCSRSEPANIQCSRSR